jgi:hypothetical protein
MNEMLSTNTGGVQTRFCAAGAWSRNAVSIEYECF